MTTTTPMRCPGCGSVSPEAHAQQLADELAEEFGVRDVAVVLVPVVGSGSTDPQPSGCPYAECSGPTADRWRWAAEWRPGGVLAVVGREMPADNNGTPKETP